MNSIVKILASLILVVSFLNLSSCSNEEKKNEKIVSTKLSQEDAMNAEMQAIDQEAEAVGKVASSLRFTLENGEFIVVTAHLSEKNEILKIEEDFDDGQKGNAGKNTFYLKDGKVFLTREYIDDRSKLNSKQDSVSQFVERISYYNKKEKVEKTIEKRVDFEDDLEDVSFVPVALHEAKIDRAKRVLDQKDEFKITFQGLINVNAIHFLIVGSSGQDAYTSAIRVDYEDKFIQTLLANQEKFMNRKIQVAFENVVDQTGFQYQSYIEGKFVE
ncbi:MAG: hypothetical protein V4622_06205 [Bacteroidota bacterium]